MLGKQKGLRARYRLRTLMLAIMWFALVLAICVQHQRTATRHRESLDRLRAAGLLPPVAMRVGTSTVARAPVQTVPVATQSSATPSRRP